VGANSSSPGPATYLTYFLKWNKYKNRIRTCVDASYSCVTWIKEDGPDGPAQSGTVGVRRTGGLSGPGAAGTVAFFFFFFICSALWSARPEKNARRERTCIIHGWIFKDVQEK